jgi:serine O-acetyltransferase
LRIGDGALIAANSLVITDVPSGVTAIGVPARVMPGSTGAPKRAEDAARDEHRDARDR